MHKLALFLLFSFLTLSNLQSQERDYLTLGDDPATIRDLLGFPDKITYGPIFSLWKYKKQYIYLYRNKIVGYSSAKELKIRLISSAKTPQKYLTMKSTPDDIIAILGTPTKLTKRQLKDEWWFNNEKIELLDGHIVRYTNATALKFQEERIIEANLTLIHEDTSEKEVIRLIGKPDELKKGITQDTWWYGSDFIIVKGGKVTVINRTPYKTKRNFIPDIMRLRDDVMPPPLRYKKPKLDKRQPYEN